MVIVCLHSFMTQSNLNIHALQANKVQVIVLAEKTVSSAQYYQSLQNFVVLELGFGIIPVPGPTEAAGLLVQMVGISYLSQLVGIHNC